MRSIGGETLIRTALFVVFLLRHKHYTAAFVPNSPVIHSRTTSTCRIQQRFATVPETDIERSNNRNKQDNENNTPTADIEMSYKTKRGQINEIDYCIAPADVSLSRALQTTTTTETNNNDDDTTLTTTTTTKRPALSLTRALNNASNRAVRRILLSKCWPSADALNDSLRAITIKQQQQQRCPVPRPILNVLTRTFNDDSNDNSDNSNNSPSPKKHKPRRSDAEYVQDQLNSLYDRYGTLPGYSFARDYLECILSLATTNRESAKTTAVYRDAIYHQAYDRVLRVLQSVGVQFVETTIHDNNNNNNSGLRVIGETLLDKDICWSVMDKIALRNNNNNKRALSTGTSTVGNDQPEESDGALNEEEEEPVGGGDSSSSPASEKRRLKFWKKNKRDDVGGGGVLLSAQDPTITCQLNRLSNVVQRSLLFGGDEELLVLAETLDADRDAFIQRWYSTTIDDGKNRPGLSYLDALIQLLRDCYSNGVVETLDPPVTLSTSYANAYERLVASAVELGSGYMGNFFGSNAEQRATNKIPRTAGEELERFAVLETQFRQQSDAVSAQSPYPDELEGSWEVRDVIGGETIGTSEIFFDKRGQVKVSEPLEGLRWRLDPGPAHLDTCTFQVLSKLDGTILQYRGFIDRGARLESRFSKRPIQIRGSVMFKMREGASFDYYKDILPINYSTGTTRFVMKKVT